MKLELGPGVLVAAAFIGPGTVTACTLAGSDFGYALVWALIFATVSTIILQDLLVGNCAYEGGNLAGGALGIDALVSGASPGQNWLVGALAVIAGLAVLIGRYDVLEKILIALVMVMSAAFVLSALFVRPDIGQFLSGLVPRIPDDGLLRVIALIGTTIVPYNLFLHAAASRRKWPGGTSTQNARTESAISIGFGGLISILILTTAASSLFKSGLEISNAADMAQSIEPAFGSAARYLVGIGLFAAGLTSAITAPMATAYALSEMIGGDENRKSKLFRATALFVVVVGAAISLSGIKPIEMILIAQYANGLLLPVMACFLLYVMNRKDLLGEQTNSMIANVAGGAIVIFTAGLGLRSILRAAGYM